MVLGRVCQEEGLMQYFCIDCNGTINQILECLHHMSIERSTAAEEATTIRTRY